MSQIRLAAMENSGIEKTARPKEFFKHSRVSRVFIFNCGRKKINMIKKHFIFFMYINSRNNLECLERHTVELPFKLLLAYKNLIKR